jgi:P27 family predicted phage terminase small subunit
MPPRGRKPKSMGVHILHGTRRTGSLSGYTGRRRSIDADSAPPEPPAHLDELARGFWQGVTAELQTLGLGFLCDRWDIEHAAQLYARARHAEELIPPGGFYLTENNEPRRHPAALEALQCRKELRIALEALGISAPGRARLLGNVRPPADSSDPSEEYFRQTS